MTSTTPAWAPIFQNIFRREQRTFLQYVHEAYPWTAYADEQRLGKLQQIIAEEQRSTVGLANYLRRQRVDLLYSRSFPLAFTALHFVSLDFLLPHLVKHQQDAIAALEQDAGKIADAEPREVVRVLVEMKRKHLQELEALAKQPVAA